MGIVDLTDEVAVVTGATSGIGRAIALELAEAGADVVPTARTESDVLETTEEIRERGSDSVAVTADVSDESDVAALIDAVVEEFGRIDVLVNNAGIAPDAAFGLPEEISMEAFDRVMSVNLRGAFLCSRAAAPHLLSGDRGAVLNVSSAVGVASAARQHAYVASKYGLVGLTKTMALDWAPKVRVNAIAPGYVKTDMLGDVQKQPGLEEKLIQSIPQRRFADTEDISPIAAFLVSDDAGYITGECMVVDGGWSRKYV